MYNYTPELHSRIQFTLDLFSFGRSGIKEQKPSLESFKSYQMHIGANHNRNYATDTLKFNIRIKIMLYSFPSIFSHTESCRKNWLL